MAENNTYKTIIDGLHCTTRLWGKVSKDLSKVSVRKLPKKKKEPTSAYVLYYNGVFTGVFLKENSIDLEELKECGWPFEGESKLFE